MILFQKIQFDGVANAITYDDGLKSTEAEPKRLRAVLVELEKYDGTDDNCQVQGYHERSKTFDIPDKLFPAELKTATAQKAAGQKMARILVEMDVPVGEVFKLAIKCASVAIAIRGAYEYELI
ncbi:hypothetical protein LCGC14_1366820 [marine sediment metagenome]|uniref:Uncharacterized protein n=1 Tax=marine sediment metagenome TaxID=412755 RepID=A0A0F9MLR8_9ZZZZ